MRLRMVISLLMLVLAVLSPRAGDSESATSVSLETDTLHWRAPQLMVLCITPTDTFVTFGDYKYRNAVIRKGYYPVSTLSDGEWITTLSAGLPDFEFIYEAAAGLYRDRGEGPLRVISTVRESRERTVQVGIEREPDNRVVLVDTTFVRIRRAHSE